MTATASLASPDLAAMANLPDDAMIPVGAVAALWTFEGVPFDPGRPLRLPFAA